MKTKSAYFFLLLIANVKIGFAQIDLSGRVLNSNSQPVFGAVVKLKKSNLADTTDSQGFFRITNGASTKITPEELLEKKIDASILVSDIKGKILADEKIVVFGNTLNRTVQNFLLEKGITQGSYSVIVTVPNGSKGGPLVFEKRISKAGNATGTGQGLFKKNSAGPESDTLEIYKENQIVTKKVIAKLIDTLPDFFIVQRDIYGHLTISTNDTISTIVESIYGGEYTETMPKTSEMGYNKQVGSFSGFTYFLYSASKVDYHVFVSVYNSKRSLIGRSEIVDFTSLFGDVEIPLFKSGNAKPSCSLGADTSVFENTTLSIAAKCADMFGGTFSKYEWKIGKDVPFVISSKADTIISVPKTLDSILCILRAWDNDNNTVSDTLLVRIRKGIPTIEVKVDSILRPMLPINFNVTAFDSNGTFKLYADYDADGIFDDSSLISKTFSRAFPAGKQKIIFKVVDNDSNIVTDTVNINVYRSNIIDVGGSATIGRFSILQNREYLFSNQVQDSMVMLNLDSNGNLKTKKKVNFITNNVGYNYFVSMDSASQTATVSSENTVKRFDMNGNVLFSNSDPHPLDTFRYFSVIYTKEKGYITLGNTSESSGKIYLKQQDALNNIVTNKIIYTSPLYDPPTNIKKDGGGYIISANIGVSNNSQALAIKLDSNFDTIWTAKISAVEPITTADVIKANDGGYVILGSIGSHPNFDIYLMKLDSVGHFQWNRRIGKSSDYEYGFSICKNGLDGYAIAGNAGSFAPGSSQTGIYVVTTDLNGNVVHEFRFDHGIAAIPNEIQLNKQNNFVVNAYALDKGQSNYKVWFLEIDQNGNMQ